MNGARALLALLIEPRGRWASAAFYAGWAAILMLAFVLTFRTMIFAPSDQGALAGARGLLGEEGRKVGSLKVEQERIAELSMARSPLAPELPPMDAALPAATGRPLLQLQRRARDCMADSEPGADYPATSPAPARLRAAYYQARIALCQGDASAAGRFQEVESFANQNASALGVRAKPFAAAAAYGRVVSLTLSALDENGYEAASLALATARNAAKAAGDGGGIIRVTPAMLDSVTIYLALAQGKTDAQAVETVRRHSRTSGAVRYPRLTANAALLASASGERQVAEALFRQVQTALRSSPDWAESPWLTREPAALGRLVASAATTSLVDVYASGDDAWFPKGALGGSAGAAAASDARAVYESRFQRGASYWFPPIALDAESSGPGGPTAEARAQAALSDAAWIDAWLWIRRGRAQLARADLTAFTNDRLLVGQLDPARQGFVREWRRAATSQVGGSLLDRATLMRRNGDEQAAVTMLTLLAGNDFPWWVSWQARLMLESKWWQVALALKVVVFLLWLAAAFGHRQVRAGYARTFPRRHYDQRTAREATERA